jgi:hypothetical protein
MKKTIVHILYGIKIIALWCLIANLTIFGFNLVREFRVKVTVENAVLKEEQFNSYPEECGHFSADMGDRSVNVITPPDRQVGDTVQVILRDGSVFKTIWDDSDYRYTTVPGRILIALSQSWQEAIFTEAVVFVLLSLLLIKQGKQIRNTYPVLTCVTHILGAVASVATLIFWAMGADNTWAALGQALMAFCSFVAYAVVMFIVWIIRTVYKNVHMKNQ